MNDFLRFLVEHWHVLTEIVFVFVFLFVITIKKKVTVVEVIQAFILEILPEAIRQAELKFGQGHGEDKLAYVCELVQSYISTKYGLKESVVIRLYHSFIRENVEDILSTPQKKEVSYGKR